MNTPKWEVLKPYHGTTTYLIGEPRHDLQEKAWNIVAESTRKERAEQIVLAVNSHQQLVEACQSFMVEWHDMLKDDFSETPLATVAEKCQSALATATGHLKGVQK